MATTSEIWSYRNLIGNLAQRELKSRYKRSLLGWLWSLINPASTLLIYTIVFGTFLRIEPPVGGNGELRSFALFLFAALMMWNFFHGVVTGSMAALLGAGPLLNKVYFPPECPAIASLLSVLTQTLLEGLILVVALVIVGNASWTFLLFPFLLFLLALFSLGIGLVISLLNVYLRDVNHLVSIGLNLLFYATPIIYPLTLVEDNASDAIVLAVKLNPLTQFVGASRDIFYLLQVPSPGRILGLAAVSVGTFLVGRAIFSRHSTFVSEEL